ncbi:hypothetical protein J3458_020736 [Metarhizium acridum]|uniref:DUF4188 domain-containing protein n=1 Tax=Metarhizium acridum (strain CQMa 102) TaxID=655827 RepID=E9E7W6_METAQ|nr:uncharacterized protein MAC_05964 [Metarhizium acridum CQMa 102]EFY87973.1 hypothetical protein MAC_05964 [Metarhizium acridum CQMa 102]KAG8407248.1 hypothetical protein J3458_020736 [Metarhizium acridum]
MGEFKPKLAPVGPPPVEKPIPLAILFFRSLLAQRQRIFLTAAVQLVICTVFPGRYAVVPIATLALAIVTTQVIDFFLPRPAKPPGYMTAVVPGRTTSLLPRADGTFGSSPSSRPLVVFNLGAQFNHPRGRLCPYGKEIADKFAEMNYSLLERRDELGLVSITDWVGSRPGAADTLMVSYFFRDVESVHRFAHEEMHRRAWDWYNNVWPDHIGIFHETFVVPAHSYETIYANCTPVMLGAGVVRCDEMQGERNWRNTLVSADSVELKSQWQRMNRDGSGIPKQ